MVKSKTVKRGRGQPRSELPGRMVFRYRPDQRALWQAEADKLGITLAAWINVTLNQAAKAARK